jgi:diacylglycerol kinase (ATP)
MGAAGVQVVLEGMFWNYLSVGADAQAAYQFHRLREKSPHLASSRLLNQFWYATFSATSGGLATQDGQA